jgi:hypothetical protein
MLLISAVAALVLVGIPQIIADGGKSPYRSPQAIDLP